MRKITLIMLWLLCSVIAKSQISFTGEYTNDFNSYVSLATLPAGWTTGGTGGFIGVGTGSGTGGGFYSFNPTSTSSDKSLGALHSGSATGYYVATFTNSTGTTITSLTVSYDFEQYRAAGNTTGWDVLFNGTPNAALAAAGLSSGVTTGVPYVLTKSTTITGLSIASGATFTIRWTVNDASGSDNPVAIDNFKMCVPGAAFSVTATNSSPVTTPTPINFSGGASLGTPTYAYSWTGPGFSSSIANPTITPSSMSNAGTYTLTVTDGVGCTASATTTVTVTPGVTCSGIPAGGTAAASPAAICGSGSAAISTTGGTIASGLTYQWQSSLTGTTGSFSDISGATSATFTTPTTSTTTHYRLVTTCTISGFSDTSTAATLTINTLPAISTTPAGGNVCSGGSGLSMTASGAVTYSWAPASGLSATTGTTITANPTANTTYTITGTDALGCVGTTTATVNYNLQPAALTITPASVVVCQGDATQKLLATGGLLSGSTVVNTGVITIPATIAALGTITRGISMSGIPAGAIVTGADVNIVSFGSQYQDDYIVNLTAPNGNILNLIKQRGTHTSVVTTLFANTILSSAGVTSLASGSGTFTGTWQADANPAVGAAPYISNVTTWSDLYSTPNGTWTISIFNNTGFSNTVVTSAQFSITLFYTYPAPITWAPITQLYTDAAGTIPYTGTAVDSVYLNPLTAAVETYTATATNSTCTSTATVTTTVNPVAAVTGTLNVCEGLTTNLSNGITGGTWTSGSTANATIDPVTGVVSGVAAGTAAITYASPAGCTAFATVTVDPIPSPVTGTLNVCEGLTTALTDITPGGAWSSSSTPNATVDPATGIVTGILAGTADITYALTTGCSVTATVTVDQTPSAITGILNVCEGLTTSLSDAIAGGTWSSPDATVSVNAVTGVVTGVGAGTATVTYTLPAGCYVTAGIIINPAATAITGITNVCVGATTTLSNTGGGTWSSSNTGVATIDVATGIVTGITPGTASILYALASGCTVNTTVTVNPLPAAITGTPNVCTGNTTLLSNTGGGTWSSSNTSVATIDAGGLVAGLAAGTTTITYTLPTGCVTALPLTVNVTPGAISGTAQVCVGMATTLTNAGGGTWTSGNTTVATAGLSTGVISGILPGTASITYTLATGCRSTIVTTVNPLPTAISGLPTVCVSSSITLTNTGGGTWSSSNSAVASVTGAGVVSGLLSGTTVISYTLGTGCTTTKTITVNPLPGAISGTTAICLGATTTLSNSGGGTWSSSNTAVANIGTTTGIITTVTAGTATINYRLGTGCQVNTIVTVNPLPTAIAGSSNVCVGNATTLSNTGGGAWSSSNSTVATVGAGTGIVNGLLNGTATITYTLGTGCTTTKTITVNSLPSAIAGVSNVCVGSTTALSNTGGGTWTSSTTSVATVGIATGIVNGLSAGTTTITYSLGTGCTTTTAVTINALPSAITGVTTVCPGSTITLSNTGGGTWTSGNTLVATVGSSTGIVTGLTPGTASITYTLGTGCRTARSITVNALPATITGTKTMCIGKTTALTNITTGGTWSSGNTSIATAAPTSGIISGIAAGTAAITYTLLTGCTTVTTVTVNPLPATITGSTTICIGSPVTLSNTGGGTWTSSNTAVATIGVTTGIVAGVSGGTTTITYALPTSCITTTTATINPVVKASVSISSSMTDTVCNGTLSSYTAVPVNGGSAPIFEWKVNGTIVGTTSGSFSYTPTNGDIVRVKVTSNAPCASPDTAVAFMGMVVLPKVTPAVSISPAPGNPVCEGQPVTFSATPVFGGSTPIYLWVRNGVSVATGPMYTFKPANGDDVYGLMISNTKCRFADTARSAHTIMTVTPVSVPAFTMNVYPGIIISEGQSDTFTAAVSTSVPHTYQWLINGTPITGATSSVFIRNDLRDRDSVTCVITNTDACGMTTYNSVIMTVGRLSVAGAAIGNNTIHVFPNPNNGSFTLQITPDVNLNEEVTLMVTKMLGQQIYKENTLLSGALVKQIQISSVANGTYILSIKSASISKVIPLTIQQ